MPNHSLTINIIKYEKQKIIEVVIWKLYVEANLTRSHMIMPFLRYESQMIVKVKYVSGAKVNRLIRNGGSIQEN